MGVPLWVTETAAMGGLALGIYGAFLSTSNWLGTRRRDEQARDNATVKLQVSCGSDWKTVELEIIHYITVTVRNIGLISTVIDVIALETTTPKKVTASHNVKNRQIDPGFSFTEAFERENFYRLIAGDTNGHIVARATTTTGLSFYNEEGASMKVDR
ncbi:hypothetical protein [Caulobacter sp. S45]|uniref:hypothetical protein n=1 Tax=Caulobacter sp. S45 TaxID=1641861 RepID=UPI0015753487|nr:hypothetical protein [Caulobacter sp. S45]